MDKLLFVAAGGALGASLRWLVATAINRHPVADVQVGTLAVNVLGCLAIGVLAAFLAGPPHSERDGLRLFLIVGLLGGFTTYSAFAFESFSLVDSHHAGIAALYVLATNVLGIGAAWGGFTAASALRGA